ncbi:hypothetical protein ABDK56_00835 [Sphingomonas sp. ASV193]|uniref:hypothetical protein n=1 Tax=Sphingomonas sp. ASV193 TaxID=3144405 RepID=UPI0032E89AA9
MQASSSATVQLPLGGTAEVNGMTIQPIRIVEDSRCRPTVQCVWAGRLVVLVALDGQQRSFELGKAQQTRVGWMTLTGGPPLTPGGVLPPVPPLLTFTVTR